MHASGVLNVSRSIDFEPCIQTEFSPKNCLKKVRDCFSRGEPAIVSLHSINFHSTLRDFRSATLRALDEFLWEIEKKYPDLQYAHDGDLYSAVTEGEYEWSGGKVKVAVQAGEFGRARGQS